MRMSVVDIVDMLMRQMKQAFSLGEAVEAKPALVSSFDLAGVAQYINTHNCELNDLITSPRELTP